MKFAIFLKSSLLFSSFYGLFLFTNKTLRLNSAKNGTAMNADKFQCLFFELNWSYIYYFIICTTVPLKQLLCYSLDSSDILVEIVVQIKTSSHRRCSVKQVFWKISQNSQKNACAGIFFLTKLDSNISVFLWILRIF